LELYRPDLAGRFVWAVVSKNDRTTPRKTQYVSTLTDSPDNLTHEGLEPVTSCPTGKFDAIGRFMTYLPPIPNHHGGLPRYVLHPWANQAIDDARTAQLHAA
jgi:hypothetical protein